MNRTVLKQVKITPEMAEQLAKRAAEETLKEADIIRRAIAQYLKQKPM